MKSAVVQVPAFEEGPSMLRTLREIGDQDVPDGWRVAFQVWVTLSPPDRELCDTWQAAVEAEGFTPFEAPPGKLSARNEAHDAAVEDGFDVIVSWDADAKPLRDDALASLLETVSQDGVVCANSRPVSRGDGLFGAVVDVAAGAEDGLLPHVNGQAHAITAAAWEKAGPFDTDLDQTVISDVRAEEEFSFYRRLSALGRVTTAPGAAVENDMRRNWCKVPIMGQSGYCETRGEKTFHPRERR